MVYYDENEEYWGNKSSPVIDDCYNRLHIGGVKMFADGIGFYFYLITF